MQALYDLLGLPIDQVKFLICQILSLLLGIVFRVYMKPNQTNSLQRHVVSTFAGLLLGFYCFDQEFLHILICSYVVYFFMVVLPRRYAHLVVLAFVMIYLSCVNIFYQYYYYGVKRFDITSPMMIIVQKLSYVAFSYYDGTRPVETLTKFQKAHVLKELPSFIEFSSYILNFQGVIIGPSCVYQDYIDFITGLNVLKHKKNTDERSDNNTVDYDQLKVNQVVIYKLLKVGLLIVLFLSVTVHLPMSSNMDPLILSKPLWYRFLYFFSSADSQRLYYYIAWTLSDAVHNVSGFGYNGFDEQTGEAKWDLLNNVNIYALETSTNIKSIIDNWHIQTSKWLRVIAFERMPRGKTLGVFVLSAFWHGFYPGYYITFIMGAILVYLGRGIRRTVRPYFLRNKVLFFFYDIVCWVVTQFTISYITAPFFFLSLKGSVQFFNSWFWCVQIVAVVLLIALPKNSLESKPRPSSRNKDTDATSDASEHHQKSQ